MHKEYVKMINQIKRWSSKTLPILQEVRIQSHKLQATDLEVWLETPAPLDLTDRMLDPDTMEFTLEPTGFDPNDFPEIELPPVLQQIELDSVAMTNILWCAKFTSKDQLRPVLTGVAMTSAGCLYGCDGYKGARRPYYANISPDYIILPPHLLALLRLAKADRRNWTMTIYGDDEPEMVAFKSGDLTIYSKLIDGCIPEYDELFEAEHSYQITIPKGMTIPKGYYIMVEMRDEVADHSTAGHGHVYLENHERKILKTDIRIEPKTSADEHSLTLDIVRRTNGAPFGVDPDLLKAWKSKSITLEFSDKSNIISVKEV